MKITISVEHSGDIVSVDLPGTLSFADFQAYLQAETEVAPAQQAITHNGQAVAALGATTLAELGWREDDLLVLARGAPTAGASGAAASGGGGGGATDGPDVQIEEMRLRVLGDPQMSAQLEQANPHLHSLLHDAAKFKEALLSAASGHFGGGADLAPLRQHELSRLQQNPDDPQNQARILELIQAEQIEENFNLAYEILPESFASVNMLYVNLKINGHQVKAFVDSGAQSTIILSSLAEEVGIARLIDKRFTGIARGVGSSKILGRIHSVTITIGDSDIAIPCTFTVIDSGVDFIFGLDMLRRHKCVIDLERDVLVVGGNIEARFLHELEIPKDNLFGAGAGGNVLGAPPAAKAPPSASAARAVAGSGGGSAGSAAAEAAVRRQAGKHNEADVERLVGLGFARAEAIQALEACQGNVEMAAAMLFN